jgi:aminopeptidase N
MRDAIPQLVQRANYAPPPYWIREVELSFDLDPAKTLVTSRLHFERSAGTAAGTPLKLDGDAITLLRIQCHGESLAFRHDAGSLVIEQPPHDERFTLDLRSSCSPAKNLELSGLYSSGGGFFTQCEAEGFRRITYFVDRPDVMARYTVTLRADKARYPVLLSNGNLVEQGELDGGRHYAKWHDPHPKPSYLFALVAAQLVAREQRIQSRSGSQHLLQVWVQPGQLNKTEHAMRSLVASVAWDEARFGLPLDLERFMIVAVDDFNMGAMENKGLNLFNTKYVLASAATATDAEFDGVESVVAHEYFHNWTGNRVTCRDWFQLSLKEGLTVFRDQQFSMDMASSEAGRAVQRVEAVRNLRAVQFREDAGPMAHPVRPDSYAAIDNFYTPTVYDKGAEVVRMQHTLVGEEGFRAGMALYFQRHDGAAVTCDDFVQAMVDANPGSALAVHLEAFKRWYSQAGTPRLTMRNEHDAQAQTWTLHFEQSCPATPGQAHKLPFVLPVRAGALDAEGQAVRLQLQGQADGAEEVLLVVSEARQSFTFTGLAQPPTPSVLRGFSAPVLLDDGLDAHALLHLLRHDRDAFNRWDAAQRIALMQMQAALQEATDSQARLDTALLGAFSQVLRDERLDPAFAELLLSLPGESALAEQLAGDVNPQRIHQVRQQMQAQLASELHHDWRAAWERHHAVSNAGSRALANLALHMLCLHAVRTGDTTWPGRAYQRVKDAANMTQRLGALNALVASRAELAAPALERFYANFEQDKLVIDNWFALQARAPEPLGAGAGEAFAKAKALMLHPAFSLKNPNRARSLVHTLCTQNPAAFHRSDAAGYVFWADQVLAIDAFNPSLAARLARALEHWRRLAEPWRAAAREALLRVQAKADLSSDTREIIDKALQD